MLVLGSAIYEITGTAPMTLLSIVRDKNIVSQMNMQKL
jgi:hypothetical protein